MLEHTPLTTSSFNGIYSRSDTSKVPYDHLQDALNQKYLDGETFTREGSELFVTLPSVKRRYTFNISGQAARTLVLGADGKLYDTTVSLITPILTIAGMVDFSAATINNRCYITPHNGLKGLANEFVYVYDGSGLARKAAGDAPTNAPEPENSVNAGNVEAGLRLIAVAFGTESGFITGISPAAQYTGPGSLKLLIDNIEVGGSAVTVRYTLSTKLLLTYDGNPENQEFFFIPNGMINDNVTTQLEVNFFDADLRNSADYLFEQLDEIEAGVGIGIYNERLMVWGSDNNENICYVSKSGEPESINEAEGFLQINTGNGGLRNGFQLRAVWYLSKDYRTVAYVDNGDEALTWKPENVDLSVGTCSHGIGQLLSEDGKNFLDVNLITSVTGLYAFNGTFADDEISWKIENIWKRINKAYFHTIEICVNPIDKEICIAVPLDSATAPSHVLYCDYSKGLDAKSVRWCIWSFPNVPTTVGFQLDFTTKIALFQFGSSEGNIYQFDPDAVNDYTNAIPNYVRFAYVGAGYSSQLCQFGELSSNIKGSGSVAITVYGLNDAYSAVQAPITLEETPLGFMSRQIMAIDLEKMSVKFSLNEVNGYMIINEFTLFARPTLERRPQ